MRLHLVFALLLSALLIYLLVTATDNEVELSESTVALGDADYDYFMTLIDNTVLNSDGSTRYRIRAERLTHYPAGDVAVLDAPVFHVYQEDASAPWQITANNARIDTEPGTNIRRIALDSEVVIHRTDDSGRPVDVYTDFLTVYPDTKTLTTDRAVSLVSPGSLVTAVGMTGDLNRNIIRLLDQVKGRHE